ncbi:acyl-CoA dehydrogenase, partial [Staphylococcus aureus]
MFKARSFLFLKSSVKLGINNLYCVLCGVTNMNDMDNSFLITTEIQRKWIE